MILEKSLQNKKLDRTNFLVVLTKILVISLVAIYLLGNFNPYFEGSDSYSYAMTAKDFSQGKFFYTNEFLFSGEEEFFPHDKLKINDGKHAIWAGPIGFFGLITTSYVLAGNYGLFYFGPIFGIIFLIVAERISSNLFGKYVGLLTLLFLSTNHLFFRSALNLQTESVYTICILTACYFLIKFFKSNNNSFLIGTSILFVFASLLRTSGVMYFPIELTLIIGFFITIKFKSRIKFQIKSNSIIEKKFSSITKKRFLKILFLILIPWILFFAFYFSYHAYFFDDPLTNRVVLRHGEENTDVKLSSLFVINEKNYENIKEYSKYVLPYQFPRIVDTSSELFSNLDNLFGKNWIGLLGLFSLLFFFIFSIWKGNNRLSMIIFSSMILITIFFFSSITSESRSLRGDLPARYMFPAFSFYYMILGIMLVNFIKYSNKKKLFHKKILLGLKIILVSILITFLLSSFYFSPPIQAISNNNFQFQNPIEFDKKYPLNKEGLSENDILVSINFEAIDYGLIPFKSLVKDKTISDNSLELLKNVLKNNYNVYTLKNPFDYVDKNIYHGISENPDFVLVDFSDSFCKIELISAKNYANELKSNPNCLDF